MRVDKIVPQLVVNHAEVFLPDLNAHLDAQIIFRIHVPSAGMDKPRRRSGWFREKRTLPKRLWQRLQTPGRREKALSVFNHPPGIRLPVCQNLVSHSSPEAWDVDSKDDLRVKMCIQIREEDFA